MSIYIAQEYRNLGFWRDLSSNSFEDVRHSSTSGGLRPTPRDLPIRERLLLSFLKNHSLNSLQRPSAARRISQMLLKVPMLPLYTVVPVITPRSLSTATISYSKLQSLGWSPMPTQPSSSRRLQ